MIMGDRKKCGSNDKTGLKDSLNVTQQINIRKLSRIKIILSRPS